jgi:DNA-binding MarR family transcriptional regulator
MKVVPETDLNRFEAAMRQLFKTFKRPQAWQVIKSSAGVDIDRSAAGILMVLIAHEPNRCRLQDLALQIGVEAPSVTRKVQQLEQAGLVVRQQDARDKRVFGIQVTAAGHDTAQKLHTAQQALVTQVFANWAGEDRELFVALFERFSSDLSALYAASESSLKNASKT